MSSIISIKPDPCFERIRKVLMLEGKPDRIPLCDFGIAHNIMEWVVDKKIERIEYKGGNAVYYGLNPEDQVKFWINAGYDYVHIRPFYNFSLSTLFGNSAGDTHGEGVGVIQTMEILHSRVWPWQRHEEFCYDNVVEIARHIPQEMKLIISTGDIFTHIWENMGFTHFCYCLYEAPELIEELFRQIGEANYILNKRTVELVGDKIGAIWYTDDLAFNTGTLVNPEVYRKYLFPWVKKLSDLSKSIHAPFLYHTDGKLWDIFDDFVHLGVNAIQPLEPKSMDAVEVKQKWGDKLCLIGNIDVDCLSRGTPNEIDTMVRDRIEKLGYNGGYCVGSSNTIAPYVNPLNFKAMVEATFKYGTIY